MKKIIYVLGNRYLKSDNFPVKLLPRLKECFPKFSFIHLDPTEEFAITSKELVIIDTVIGINKVTKFNDLNYFVKSPKTTVHDFDLSISLGLLKKLGKLKKITIIGVPVNGVRKKIIEEIRTYIKNIMDT